ncbi:hypothetical protein EH228_12850 [Erwinia endophytica]|nr:hypothetical protein EH228_12850 [Erwinia endophytica]
MSHQQLSIKEKIGYGLGDTASHIVFDNVMLYLMFFYTDIFGLPAAFVGTMFLQSRLDTVNTPFFYRLRNGGSGYDQETAGRDCPALR